jgi:hypothetical protein
MSMSEAAASDKDVLLAEAADQAAALGPAGSSRDEVLE